MQTDCEMLSIEVMEAYAKKYSLTGNEVAELFHENQVFEKMLIQHEYLHQVSFEEVIEINSQSHINFNATTIAHYCWPIASQFFRSFSSHHIFLSKSTDHIWLTG